MFSTMRMMREMRSKAMASMGSQAAASGVRGGRGMGDFGLLVEDAGDGEAHGCGVLRKCRGGDVTVRPPGAV